MNNILIHFYIIVYNTALDWFGTTYYTKVKSIKASEKYSRSEEGLRRNKVYLNKH